MVTIYLKDFNNLIDFAEMSFEILNKEDTIERSYLDYLFNIYNVTLRTAVERYARGVMNYSGNDLMNKFVSRFDEIIENHKIHYDKNNNQKENPLDINRYIRNQFVHDDPKKPVRGLVTKMSTVNLLQQKILINYKNKPTLPDRVNEWYVEFENSDSVNTTGVYLEYLTKEVRKLIEKIDNSII